MESKGRRSAETPAVFADGLVLKSKNGRNLREMTHWAQAKNGPVYRPIRQCDSEPLRQIQIPRHRPNTVF